SAPVIAFFAFSSMAPLRLLRVRSPEPSWTAPTPRLTRHSVRTDGAVLHAGPHERLRAGHVERTSEEKALPAVAVLSSELGELLRLLDALGKCLDRESLAELDEGVNEGLALLVLAKPGDERPVDLQRVHREPLEMSERGVSRSEVVDRDAYPELLQRCESAR